MKRVRHRLALQTVVAVSIGLLVVGIAVELTFSRAMDVLADSLRARAGAQAMHLANELAFPVAAGAVDEVEAAVGGFVKSRPQVGALAVRGAKGAAVMTRVGAEVPAEAIQRIIGPQEASIAWGEWVYAASPILNDGKLLGHVILGEEQAVAHAERNRSRLVCYLTYLAVIAFIALGASIIGARFGRPLEQMAAVARRVDAGDLSHRMVQPPGADEIAQLGRALRQMIEALRQQVGAIQTASSGVIADSTSVMGAMSQVSQAASEQASAIAEVSTSAEQVRRNSKISVENARQIVDSAEKSVHDSTAGSAAVDSSVVVMKRLREQVDSIAAAVERLRGQVGEVGEVIATVGNIAGQSNLLAVNASIEAAKAGEFGRGFAVVAHEVRNLAAQSRGATTRVRNTLGSIQNGIEEVVALTRTGREAAEAGEKSIGNTGEVIGGLSQVISSTAQIARQIATGAHEQLVGIEEIVQAMGAVKRTAHENLDSTRQVEASSRKLSAVAQELQRLSARYHVGKDGAAVPDGDV